MTQSAVAFDQSTNGRERITDGLWTHRGNTRIVGILNLGPSASNAMLIDWGADDPATPGQRLVLINALTVAPGRLHAASLQVNGPLIVSGALTLPNGSITTPMLAPGAAQQLLGQWGPSAPSYS